MVLPMVLTRSLGSGESLASVAGPRLDRKGFVRWDGVGLEVGVKVT